tara:strand:- start:272 stop:1033 length:762 start_codon:yes stop_codon:yes gene_type:complete
MNNFLSWKGSPTVAYYLRKNSLCKEPWHLKWKPVCASTETELSRWLNEKPYLEGQSRAVLAARQVYGTGQGRRIWCSPIGGVWLSAVIPIKPYQKSTGLFTFAVAVAIAKKLKERCIPVRIKWPNDLMVDNRKLAGLLPKIIFRGSKSRLARVGVGLNVFNKVPKEGISLQELFGQSNMSTAFWSAEVLIALSETISLLESPDSLVQEVEKMLWSTTFTDPETSLLWDVDGIDSNGSLKVRRGNEYKTLSRWD